MIEDRSRVRSTSALIATGSPTRPRSSTFSMLESDSRSTLRSLRARTRSPSFPDRPTATPPARLIAVTICLFIEPLRTISTISTVAWSVTR